MNETEDFRPASSPDALGMSDLSGSEGKDSDITRAVEDYRALLQTGCRPQREAFLARYPELAPALAECLDALDFLHHAAPQLQESAAEHRNLALATAVPPELPLGDFRLLREVGRGGMGIVYEAKQLSLGRRVALKLLPFAAALDARQLQRFKNEAQAAAALHHRNIVPVFAVGCASGVHYYAMQFIEGQTLAAMIRQLRQLAGHVAPVPASEGVSAELAPNLGEAEAAATPSPGAVPSTEKSTRTPAFFRTVAQLGVQAAEALEHAHQVGVVHRDIKPANLLLDGVGNLWIADFGLAKFHEDQLTLTGDIVGTLRYMSPEQALGKQVAVDHRTDIYSLGATLYELLTLEPAIAGGDRQEMLRRLAAEEARAPRQWNKAIPTELETIVLKALAKEPGERFATAQELADDLRRFLEDRPILARRPTVRQRLARWSRQHKAMVTVTLVCTVVGMVAAIAILAVKNSEIQAKQEQTHQAEQKARREEKIAKKALADEKEVREHLADALAQEKLTRYFHTTALIHREWWADNGDRSRELLAECPTQLRGWEWYYLHRLCHSELLTLDSQTSGPRSIAFSPDGRFLATGSTRAVKLWDAQTGRELRTFSSPSKTQWLAQVAFSPDGQFLAASSKHLPIQEKKTVALLQRQSSKIIVWNVHTGQTVFTLSGHTHGVTSIAFSPKGERLASTGLDNTLILWDMKTGQMLHTFPGKQIACVTFHPDGVHLATASYDKTLKILDAITGQVRLIFPGHRAACSSVAYSADGQRLASADVSGIIKVWDMKTGQEVLSFQGHTASVSTVAFSPDGRRLASVAGNEMHVRVWDAATGLEVQTFRWHNRPLQWVTFSPDGVRLASAADGTVVKVWDLTVAQAVLTLPRRQEAVYGLTFSPNGRLLTTQADRSGSAVVWEVATGQALPKVLRLSRANSQGRFSPDGKYLFSIDPKVGIKACNLESGQEQLIPLAINDALGNRFDALVLSPDGRHLATVTNRKTVRFWDATNGKLLWTHLAPKDSFSGYLYIHFHGPYLVIASQEQSYVLQTLTGRAMPELGVLFGRHALAVSPDGRYAVLHDEREVKVVALPTGKEVFALKFPPGNVTALTFSPDGKRLVMGLGGRQGGRGAVKFWDTQTGQETLSLPSDTSITSITNVVFSPDGRCLATGSGSGMIKIYDTAELSAEERVRRFQGRQRAWHQHESQDCEAAGQWSTAVWHLDRLLTSQPRDGNLHGRRSLAHCHLGDWDKAAEDAAKAIQFDVPVEDLEMVFRLAWLRLRSGDAAGYRRLCARVWTRFGTTEHAETAYLVVRISTLAPNAVSDPIPLVSLALQRLTTSPKRGAYFHALGAAHYRAGQLDQAVARFQESLKKQPNWSGQVLTWLFLAMAEHRLGRPAVAKRWMDRAANWIVQNSKNLPDDAVIIPSQHPHTYLALRLLYREAEVMLSPPRQQGLPSEHAAPARDVFRARRASKGDAS